MANEIEVFSFVYGNAWLLYGWGYRAELKIENNKSVINWSVDDKVFRMDITNRITEFISFLDRCGMSEWNGKRYYTECVLDGTQFELNISYNSQSIRCSGMNGAPEKFDLFMTGLHNEWGLPMAEYDGQEGFSWKREIENAISEEINV